MYGYRGKLLVVDLSRQTARYDPLALAVSPRGACHNRSSAYDFDLAPNGRDGEPNRGEMVVAGEDFAAVLDSLILSKFLRRCFTDFYTEATRIYGLITGWEVSAQELRQVGERINNLRKAYNTREGWTRADDTLPPRILEPENGLSEDELRRMVADYYNARGWTPEGLIPRDKLEELALTGPLGDGLTIPSSFDGSARSPQAGSG